MNKKVYLITLLLLLIGFFFFKGMRGKYTKYHEAAFNSKIENIHRYKRDFKFSVNGEQYTIIPDSASGSWGESKRLTDGDRVYKKAGTDTMKLTHQKDEIIYIVAKKQ